MTAALVTSVLLLVAAAAAERRRAALVRRAEHELRGALTAIALEAPGVDLARARAGLADLQSARGWRRAEPSAARLRLDRVVWSAATRADIAARRAGGGVHLDWRAGEATVRADHGRLAQALGNLLDNAIEHGGGRVCVSARRTSRGVRVVVSDLGAAPALPLAAGAEDIHVAGCGRRGDGLAIATAAVRDCGGTLRALPAERGTALAIELPLA